MKYNLVLEEYIIMMHDDLDPWVNLGVGYNDKQELVFELSYDSFDDYDEGNSEWSEYIIVDEKGIDILLKKMRTTRMKLPRKCMYTFGIEEECWSPREVYSTFYAIQHYLSGLRIRYRLERHDED